MIINNDPGRPEIDHAMQSFRARGLRLTRPRRAILECLGASRDWLRPASILAKAKLDCPSLGLVTVYRTLSWLHEQGLIRRVHLPDGCHGYALAGLSHGHYLVCQTCQQVIEFSNCGLENLEADMTRRTGFHIQGHMLQLVGICPSCQELSAEDEEP